ncbi:unnamed protein product [Paramecium primaurelia]|uniref:Uncharacterized protein n=1 Tax=Paramecium primaurelia TaxID=5886 RepID=A0A8S1QQS5_PARPR|nr:unnamed protein product [Paramecium primaurelia]
MNSNSGLNCDRALDFTTLENKGVGQQIAPEKMQSRPNEEHRWGEVIKTSLSKIDSRDHKLLVIQTLFSEKGVDLNLSEFSLGEMEGIPMYIQHSLNMKQLTGLIQEVRFIAQKTGSFLGIIRKLRNVENVQIQKSQIKNFLIYQLKIMEEISDMMKKQECI